MAALKNCINSGEPAVATARFPIITNAMLNAAANGMNATHPSSATLGRMMSKTPPKAIIDAIHLALLVRSLSSIALSTAVIIGLVKPIAVASANGIRNIEEKNNMVAAATAKPRSNCTFGWGKVKAPRPSLIKSKVPSPTAPIV